MLGGLGHAEAIGSRTRRPEAEDRQADAGVATYRRREPEKSLLHETVREHLKTFPAEFEQDGRVRCTACGDELLVAFSCKGRGICPSCTTRRMQGTATHLVDRVLPRVPMRQRVLKATGFLFQLAGRRESSAPADAHHRLSAALYCSCDDRLDGQRHGLVSSCERFELERPRPGIARKRRLVDFSRPLMSSLCCSQRSWSVAEYLVLHWS